MKCGNKNCELCKREENRSYWDDFDWVKFLVAFIVPLMIGLFFNKWWGIGIFLFFAITDGWLPK